jgi:protein gp37
MSEATTIPWCHHSFNPWWGCSHVSPGCVHCYAEAWAKRTGHRVWGPHGQRRTFGEPHWAEPLAWNDAARRAGERRRVFCASMADVFEDHPALSAERAKLWALIEATPRLDWQLLTKRVENVMGMAPGAWSEPGDWPGNVWVGTSVESQQWANERIPVLLQIPARVRFLSCEPLLERVDLRRIEPPSGALIDCLDGDVRDPRDGLVRGATTHSVDWVIAGGESGPHARRMDPGWARTIRDDCAAAGVPFLFKQTGSVLAREWGLRDAKGEDPRELSADLRVRQWPTPLVVAGEALL